MSAPPALNLHILRKDGEGVGRGKGESGLQPSPGSAGCCSAT